MNRLVHALLRRFIGGPEAEAIRCDLAELFDRERARGMSRTAAAARYLRRLAASAISTRRGRWTRRGPGITMLDLKLAVRLLARRPGLTLLGGLALVFGIPAALAPFQLILALRTPPPVDRPDRVAGIQLEHIAPRNAQRPTIHDVERWRRSLRSFEIVAAAFNRADTIKSERLTEVAHGAEMSASAFDVFGVAPILGRALTPGDENPASPPVVVIGDDFWRDHFGRDARAIGARIQVGRTSRVVVGVMPAAFQFPSRQSYWLPLQLRDTDVPVGEGPRLLIFGRLRDGVTIEEARAEVSVADAGVMAAYPAVYRGLHANVLPYTEAVTNLHTGFRETSLVVAIALLLLTVACGNVGTLMLARLATRSTEIAVRLALGASRARIVLQIFIEALVLTLASAALGLVVGQVVMRALVPEPFWMSFPFWVRPLVTPMALWVAGGLAVFSATIAGLLPALRATRAKAGHALKHAGPGLPGVGFGRAATALIVVEVALAITGLSGVSAVARGAFKPIDLGGIPDGEYLTTTLTARGVSLGPAEATPDSRAARMAWMQAEIERRLRLDPAVRDVTVADLLPGMDFHDVVVEIESASAADAPVTRRDVRIGFVAPGFFAAVQRPAIAGREFRASDAAASARGVIVNRSFVDQVLGGRSAIGVRLRRFSNVDQTPGPWREIIGVVPDLGMNVVSPEDAAGMYEPMSPGAFDSVQLVVRVNGAPLSYATSLRSIVHGVDPDILIERVSLLSDVLSERLFEARLTGLLFVLIAGVSFLLSAAGLYALVAFSVSQRTREIAIRTALGARRHDVVRQVIARAGLQLGAGVACGAGLAILVVPEAIGGYRVAEHWGGIAAIVAGGMAAIGLAACVAPTRRAIRIQPSAALKEQG